MEAETHAALRINYWINIIVTTFGVVKWLNTWGSSFLREELIVIFRTLPEIWYASSKVISPKLVRTQSSSTLTSSKYPLVNNRVILRLRLPFADLVVKAAKFIPFGRNNVLSVCYTGSSSSL